MATACDETFIEKEKIKVKLDQTQFGEIVNNRNDFNSFIKLHIHNQQVISSLSEQMSLKLGEYYNSLEGGKEINLNEAKVFLNTIDFRGDALNFLLSTVNFLNSKYTFNEDDLNIIITLRSQKYSHNGKTQGGCDNYCTMRANDVYPIYSNSDVYQHIKHDVYYAGCMDGCTHPQEE